MFRYTLTKVLTTSNGRFVNVTLVRTSATTPAKVPEKIEVFVDDKSVLVEPGTTVLQVSNITGGSWTLIIN